MAELLPKTPVHFQKNMYLRAIWCIINEESDDMREETTGGKRMLEKLDLTKALEKDEYKEKMLKLTL